MSDPQKRAVYDQYGEEGLKGQVPPPGYSGFSGEGGGSTTFRFNSRNPNDIFTEFFGQSNPFSQNIFTEEVLSELRGVGGTTVRVPSTKAPSIERVLLCSLEDLYNGTTRKMKISRDVMMLMGELSF